MPKTKSIRNTNQKKEKPRVKTKLKDKNKKLVKNQTEQKPSQKLKNLKKIKTLNSKQIKSKRPIIKVKNLVKKYQDFVAVNSISFDVMPGEVFGLLGPNGAGKTTTLEIIETLTPKTDGMVLVDGLDIDKYPNQVKQSIGVQLQSGGFYPRLNLMEQIELFADIYNVSINPLEVLRTVSLEDKRFSTVDELSGGQRQRFSIATTLIANPKIIFLDEPTTGLDPQARINIWETIEFLKSQGKTIILTTHYMEEAEKLCDRIAIMDRGEILEINTPKKFIQELLERGFKKQKTNYEANLEDVFLDLTGKKLRD